MVGIDHTLASIAQREKFAFTSIQAFQAMQEIVRLQGIRGCVLVVTCNRTELWINSEEETQLDLSVVFCDLKAVKKADYQKLLSERQDQEAIQHLFETASGLKSQVWGEDQILAQIKGAIEKAREAKTADEILEKLFQSAITAAKRVKTTIKLTKHDVSVVTKALETIYKERTSLQGLTCLVIGNGEIGRKTAAALAAEGAKVTVTLRQRGLNLNLVPEGCQTIAYEERLALLKDADIVVSATISPHYTLKKEQLALWLSSNKRRIFIDLAVPRDIDPAIASFPGVLLLDMDHFGVSYPEPKTNLSCEQAMRMIADCIQDFNKWVKMRQLAPVIQSMALSTTERIVDNLRDELERIDLDQTQKENFTAKLSGVTNKALQNMIYQLRDNLDEAYWEEWLNHPAKIVK